MWILTAIALLAAGALMLSKYNAVRTFYFEETEDMVANPYQGAYFQWSAGDAEGLGDVVRRHPDCRVVLLTYDLDDERELDVIPEDKLNKLSRALDKAEELKLSRFGRAHV